MDTFREVHDAGPCSAAGGPPSVDGLDHHLNRSQGVRPAPVLGPEDAVLVLASVVAASVPDPVEVGVRAGVVPPASFVEVGAVPCEGRVGTSKYRFLLSVVFCKPSEIPVQRPQFEFSLLTSVNLCLHNFVSSFIVTVAYV